MINKAIPILFNKPDSVFLKIKVYDLLFGGIIFNCTTKDFSASAVCAVLKKEAPFLETVSRSVFKFSILNQVCKQLQIFFFFMEEEEDSNAKYYYYYY